MNLQTYDGHCVRIMDTNGDVFEGICSHYQAAYNQHAYGRHEESVQIVNIP